MAVTPYYASLIREWSPRDPIVRMCVPLREELRHRGLPPDPFDEEGHTVVPGVIRRYADRVALCATRECAVRCRHCTRRNELVTNANGATLAAADAARAAEWLRRHPEVREALVTGGDPLCLSDRRLDELLGALRAVPTVRVIRIGTRMPVLLPARITRSVCRVLRRHHPVWLNTHFNHPAEITPASAEACRRLVDAGVPVGNQTVLLRGVNDDARTLEDLFRGLVEIRVRPYYLLHCDPVRGAGHFRVPLRRALRLVAMMRRRLTGLAIPQFVIDVPGGESKVPLAPGAVVRWTRDGAVIRGPDGRHWTVRDP